MHADRLLADEQPVADLAVRPALGDQREDLELALATARTCRRRGSRSPPGSAPRRSAPAGTMGEDRRSGTTSMTGTSGASISSSTTDGSGISARRRAREARAAVAVPAAPARSRQPRPAAPERPRAPPGHRPARARQSPRPRSRAAPRPGASVPARHGIGRRARATPGRRRPTPRGSSRPSIRRRNARAVASSASASWREPERVGYRRARDGLLGLGEDPRGAFARRGHVGDPATVQRFDDDRGVDLEGRRGHPRDEHPVVGRADAAPAALDGPHGIGDVAAPQGERRGGAIGRDGELDVAPRLELDEDPAEQAAGLFAAPMSRSRP